jgi:integrase
VSGVGIPTGNRKPRIQNARDRRLRPGELQRLEAALEETRNPLIRPLVLLAVKTALRRGELLMLQWRHIDCFNRTAHIPDTKTGHARTIPLNDQAVMLINSLTRDDDRVFPMTAMALKLAWNRLRITAGMPDLRLHDLRHEAISRFSEMGLTAIELSVISGHRDPRMLFRYAHLRPSDLAKKLAGRSWQNEVADLRHPPLFAHPPG